MTDKKWVRCDACPPPRGMVVLTKIDDEKGCRNEQELMLDNKPGSRLWFLPDRSMYVYYEPTHWTTTVRSR